MHALLLVAIFVGLIGVMVAIGAVVVWKHDAAPGTPALRAPTGGLVVRVRDLDDVVIHGASVTVNGVSTVTDRQGAAHFEAVPDYEVALTVSAQNPTGSEPPAYQTFTGTVTPGQLSDRIAHVVLEGWSALESVWSNIRTAVTNLQHGPQEVVLSYSYMLPGVWTATGGETREIQEHFNEVGAMTQAEFRSEIEGALQFWIDLFETAFSPAQGYAHQLTVRFVESVETSPTGTLASYTVGDNGIADFRIGVYNVAESGVLAYAYGPSEDNYGGDMFFNAHIDWRKDEDLDDVESSGVGGAPRSDGGYSVKYTAAHEFGHALGIGHNVSVGSIMFFSAGDHYALKDFHTDFIHEIKALQGIYAG